MYEMGSSLRIQLCSKACILSVCPLSVSRFPSLIERWRLQGTCIVGRLRELLVHNLLSLAINVMAIVILIWSSAVLVPTLDMVAPKYLKLVTFDSFSTFIMMFAQVFFVL
ncbi:hypothetical protein DPMN_023388 [Dreissena polymorpha]|uniref:Uncharacterized protein n=1 Tax=Dreissena polymorpha TaxID=45954 RepID=A0A9D4RAP0_DREPO|nr:hypothetical protein DPMN_023388 [Dreissena polymorpha]